MTVTVETAAIRAHRIAEQPPAPRVSVIVPTYNEAENLPYVFERMPLDVYEVLVVDGGSTDGTVEQAAYLWPGVRILRQTRTGKGNALACGFAAARGDIVVTVDADGSADPAEIPRFVASADYAKGSRFVAGAGSVDITSVRRLGNRVLNGLVNLLHDVEHTDLCYGYNAIWRHHLGVFGLDPDAPPPTGGGRLWGDGFEIETLMTLRALQADLTIREVPSFERVRRHGTSNLHATSDGLRVLRTIGRVAHENRQVRRAARTAQALTVSVPAAWTRVAATEVELSQPLPHLRPSHPGARRTRVLVRLHGHPLGEIDVDLPEAGLPPGELAGVVRVHLGAEICDHLQADGVSASAVLSATGLPSSAIEPGCVRARREAQENGPHITVVVATHNRTESLLRTLRDLADQDYPRFDVLVVDSAPADHATADALRSLHGNGPALRYLRLAEPGLALAHNAALPHVRGTWVAFTDDDVEIDSGWLTAIATAAHEHPDVGCVTGLVLPAELETYAQDLLEQFGGYGRGFTSRTWSLAEPAADPLFPYTAGRFGSGANMAYRLDALRAVGGFDPATGAGTEARGGDDLLGFLRIVRAGHALTYRPDAIVRHHHHRDLRALHHQIAGYGVGLGAYATAAVAGDPAVLLDLLRRAAPAARHLLSPSSAKNRAKAPIFPICLTRAERRGLVSGPRAYVRSRRTARSRRPPTAEIEALADPNPVTHRPAR